MSSNFYSSFLILSILLAVLANLNVAAAETDVEDLCSKTINSTICEKILNSDLAAKATELPELVQFLVVSIYASANVTIQDAKDLVKEARDPVEKKKYKSCLENYAEVVETLDKVKDEIKSKECSSATFAVATAQTYVDDCNNDIVGVSKELEQANELIMALGSILSVVCSTAKDEL